MIIEDDFDTQFLFTECLRAEKYDVVPMDHGKKALEYLRSNGLPDLILMDLTTPFLSPEDFITGLREMPSGSETPVILVSGKADITDYAKRLNASGFIKKPFDLDPLLAMITKNLH